MIIDLILDRKGGDLYSAHDFYFSVYEYRDVFPKISDSITAAMDYGTEDDVKAALCSYVINNDYNPEICDYINSVPWLIDDRQMFYCRRNMFDSDTGAVVFEIGKFYTASCYKNGGYWIPIPGKINEVIAYYPGGFYEKYLTPA